jgi:hypothetical protein
MAQKVVLIIFVVLFIGAAVAAVIGWTRKSKCHQNGDSKLHYMKPGATVVRDGWNVSCIMREQGTVPPVTIDKKTKTVMLTCAGNYVGGSFSPAVDSTYVCSC